MKKNQIIKINNNMHFILKFIFFNSWITYFLIYYEIKYNILGLKIYLKKYQNNLEIKFQNQIKLKIKFLEKIKKAIKKPYRINKDKFIPYASSSNTFKYCR